MIPQAMDISVRIYNLAGELVRTISDTPAPRGLTYWEWDGKNFKGELAANGTYFVQIITGKKTQFKKVIVLKLE